MKFNFKTISDDGIDEFYTFQKKENRARIMYFVAAVCIMGNSLLSYATQSKYLGANESEVTFVDHKDALLTKTEIKQLEKLGVEFMSLSGESSSEILSKGQFPSDFDVGVFDKLSFATPTEMENEKMQSAINQSALSKKEQQGLIKLYKRYIQLLEKMKSHISYVPNALETFMFSFTSFSLLLYFFFERTMKYSDYVNKRFLEAGKELKEDKMDAFKKIGR